MVEQHMRAALTVVLDRLARHPVVWALTGSLAHALQGVPLTPKDIDLQTNAAYSPFNEQPSGVFARS